MKRFAGSILSDFSLNDLVIIGGFLLLGRGLYLISLPLALIVVGSVLVLMGLAGIWVKLKTGRGRN